MHGALRKASRRFKKPYNCKFNKVKGMQTKTILLINFGLQNNNNRVVIKMQLVKKK